MGTDASEAKITQCDKILRYIRDFGSITQLDALREFGCMRLASRVSDINRQYDKYGCRVYAVREESVNRYGEKIHYARYYIQ